MKTCIKCGEAKAAESFSRNKRMKDGRVNCCKSCAAEYARKWIAKNREQWRRKKAAQARRARSAAIKDIAASIRRAYQDRHPERRAAHLSVSSAVRAGKLTRQPCEVCGSEYRIEAHHEDYSRHLDVVWLCRQHHIERHEYFKPRALGDAQSAEAVK